MAGPRGQHLTKAIIAPLLDAVYRGTNGSLSVWVGGRELATTLMCVDLPDTTWYTCTQVYWVGHIVLVVDRLIG